MELKSVFGDNCRIRMHVDHNEQEKVLVYEYFIDDLLYLVSNERGLPIKVRKLILREVGLALRDLHRKHWIHAGMIR